ncbi:MAG TPA: septum formation family protein [Nocardioides sp.]|uniref:septum formation family protein n=1 Tax=Nocardioides sp. TaxID=35761 RepID=UPI002F41E120
MTMLAPRVLAAAAALTLTALATAGTAYAAEQRAGELAGGPAVGACSTMTAEQAAAAIDRSTAVPCSEKHTAQVAGVVQLPSGMQWSGASRADLFRVVAGRCLPEVAATLGRDTRTRDSSAYDYVWFEPSKRERSQGARWLSCSVIRPKAALLITLPTSRTPFLASGTLRDGLARCMTKAGDRTPCSAGHLWRATGTFVVSGRYPGPKALNRTATNRCRTRVAAGKPYRWTYGDKVTWNVAHDHVVVCFSKTRS